MNKDKQTAPKPVYMTTLCEQRLRAELKELLYKLRPEMVETVSWAAGNGDRSENGDYIYGKRRLREIDSRVRFLNKRLDELQVVDRPPDDTSKVRFGAWVTLEDEAGDEKRWRIVGPDEFDLGAGNSGLTLVEGAVAVGIDEEPFSAVHPDLVDPIAVEVTGDGGVAFAAEIKLVVLVGKLAVAISIEVPIAVVVVEDKTAVGRK